MATDEERTEAAMHLRDQVLWIRNAKGLSEKELALAAQAHSPEAAITSQSLNRILNGERATMSYETLFCFYETVGLPMRRGVKFADTALEARAREEEEEKAAAQIRGLDKISLARSKDEAIEALKVISRESGEDLAKELISDLLKSIEEE